MDVQPKTLTFVIIASSYLIVDISGDLHVPIGLYRGMVEYHYLKLCYKNKSKGVCSLLRSYDDRCIHSFVLKYE